MRSQRVHATHANRLLRGVFLLLPLRTCSPHQVRQSRTESNRRRQSSESSSRHRARLRQSRSSCLNPFTSQRGLPDNLLQHYGRRFTSRSICPVHRRNSTSSQRDSQTKRSTSRPRKVSAFLPEKVSIRHFRYSLLHGAKRWPRVAFQTKRTGANMPHPSPLSIERKAQPKV